MLYLETFTFPDEDRELDYLILGQKRTCYTSLYPFKILSQRQFHRVDFEPITIFYGGNGSGKTTALNIIAEKLGLKREALYNRSNFFETYLSFCEENIIKEFGEDSCIITSDDVFDYMLNIRAWNGQIDSKREELFERYLEEKHSNFRMRSLSDYEQLKRVNKARSVTQSQYVREQLTENIREFSNGESAFFYFTEHITEKGLFLLDEPENSLSPERQLELVKFIESSARFYDCQFVIATHSPFLLSMKGAKIYDLSEDRVDVKRWTELENVRIYYEFFKQHEDEF